MRVTFGVGMNGHVRLIQVRNNGITQRPRLLFDHILRRWHLMLSNQHSDTGTLWLIILTSNIQDVSTNDIDDFRQDLGQSISTV